MRPIVSNNYKNVCFVFVLSPIVDFYQNPEESESSGGDQSDVGPAIRGECLRHQPCRPLGVILVGQFTFFFMMASSYPIRLSCYVHNICCSTSREDRASKPKPSSVAFSTVSPPSSTPPTTVAGWWGPIPMCSLTMVQTFHFTWNVLWGLLLRYQEKS